MALRLSKERFSQAMAVMVHALESLRIMSRMVMFLHRFREMMPLWKLPRSNRDWSRMP